MRSNGGKLTKGVNSPRRSQDNAVNFGNVRLCVNRQCRLIDAIRLERSWRATEQIAYGMALPGHINYGEMSTGRYNLKR